MRFVAMALLLGMGLGAQAPQFDAVSIKLSPNPARVIVGVVPPLRGGRWQARNISLAGLITYAYGLHCCNLAVAGGPGWVKSKGFDVAATTATATLPTDQLQAMLRQLLANRFRLASHATTEKEPVYTLTVAPGGARLRPATAACDPNAPIIGAPGKAMRCGALTSVPSGAPDTYTLNGRSITMAELAQFCELSFESPEAMPERPVVDRTGLAGAYDFEITFTLLHSLDGGPPMADADAARATYLGLEKAFSGQAGLKLDLFRAVKLPIPVRIVDSATLPTN